MSEGQKCYLVYGTTVVMKPTTIADEEGRFFTLPELAARDAEIRREAVTLARGNITAKFLEDFGTDGLIDKDDIWRWLRALAEGGK